MAEYDLNGVAERATAAAFDVLPTFDKLMRLSAHEFVKTIVVAAAPTIEDEFKTWLIAELTEAGVMVDTEALQRHLGGQEGS